MQNCSAGNSHAYIHYQKLSSSESSSSPTRFTNNLQNSNLTIEVWQKLRTIKIKMCICWKGWKCQTNCPAQSHSFRRTWKSHMHRRAIYVGLASVLTVIQGQCWVMPYESSQTEYMGLLKMFYFCNRLTLIKLTKRSWKEPLH